MSPVTVSTEYLYTDSSGKKWVFTQDEAAAIKPETTITLTCSGPRCQARNARPEPFTLTWVQEKLAQDPLSMPDSFFQVLKVGVNTSPATEYVFCGKECLRDWLTYSFIPPLSPRQQNERAKQEQTEKLAELNPYLVRKTDGLPSAEDLDKAVLEPIAGVTALVDGPAPVFQADGYSGNDPGDEHDGR